MYSLRLYNRLAQSASGYRGNYTRLAHNWTRSIAAIGGFMSGSFDLSAAELGRNGLIDFYQDALGWRVEERTGSVVSWEGEIVQMDLTLNGITYRRTLDTRYWYNKVKVRYGPDDETAYAEETGSSEVYGESVLIDIVQAGYDSTSARARRDRLLEEGAYPVSRAVGGLANEREDALEDGLHVVCAGYVFSLNRRYQETDIAAANASDQITTLVGNSEFVTAGSIDENTLQVAVNVSGMPTRLWDAIRDIIELGDASGNRWVGGVYEGRKFDYHQAETSVTHYYRDGRLTQRGGAPVPPSLIRPDIVVQITDAPLVGSLPNAGTWENPRNVYVEAVEFVAPDGFRLIPRMA